MLKFGWKTLFRNYIRMILGFLLAAVSFAMAGISIFGEAYDLASWEKRLLTQGIDGYRYLVIGIKNNYLGGWNMLEGEYLDYEAFCEIDGELQAIGGEYAMYYGASNSTNPISYLAPYRLSDYVGSGEEEANLFVEYNNERLFAPTMGPARDHDGILSGEPSMTSEARSIYTSFYRQVTVFSSEKAIEEFGYTLIGKFPQETDEVAIPQWLYNCFLYYGYHNQETDEIESISSPDDIIGKTIRFGSGMGVAKIVGVIEMDYKAEGIEDDMILNNNGEFVMMLKLSASPLFGVAISRAALDLYQDKTVKEKYIYSFVVSCDSEYIEQYADLVLRWKKTGSLSSVFFGDDSYFTDGTRNFHIDYFQGWFDLQNLQNNISAIYRNYIRIFNKFIPILCVFSVLFFAYLITGTVFRRQRQIGILQAMGAKKKDIALSLWIPFLFYTLGTILFSLILQFVYLSFLNRMIVTIVLPSIGSFSVIEEITFFSMTPASVLFTICVPIVAICFIIFVVLAIFGRNDIIENIHGKEKQKKKSKKETNAKQKTGEKKKKTTTARTENASLKRAESKRQTTSKKSRKTGLRLQSIFKVGFHGLLSSSWRLLLTVFLAAVALGFFGMSVSATAFDANRAREDAVFTQESVVGASRFLREEDFLVLETHSSGKPARFLEGALATQEWTYFWGDNTIWTEELRKVVSSPKGLLSADEAFLKSYAMSLVGRLPAARDEVAISTCQLNAFLTFGYYDHISCPVRLDDNGYFIQDSAYKRDVASAEDLIAGEFRVKLALPDGTEIAAKIVGVVDYGVCAHTHEENSAQPDRYDKLFVSEEFLAEYCALSCGEGYVARYAVFPDMTTANARHKLFSYVNDSEEYAFVSSELNILENHIDLLANYQKIFAWLAAAFTIFSAMLIWYFISFSMEKKKIEIAIFRALGATRRDCGLMFVAESILLAILQSIAGIIAGFALSGVFNGVLKSGLGFSVSFIVFSPIAAAAVLFVGIAVSLLSAIIPICRTTKKSPVDAIRENQE